MWKYKNCGTENGDRSSFAAGGYLFKIIAEALAVMVETAYRNMMPKEEP